MPSLGLFLILHELLCAALFYVAFCRALRASERTSVLMRGVIKLMGLVACAGMAAPMAFGYRPDWFSVTLLALVVLEVAMSSARRPRERGRRELA